MIGQKEGDCDLVFPESQQRDAGLDEGQERPISRPVRDTRIATLWVA